MGQKRCRDWTYICQMMPPGLCRWWCWFTEAAFAPVISAIGTCIPAFYALQRGFALASVNYRLAPAAKFPTPVEDVKKLSAFLRVHAREYGLSGEKMFLYGTSAGGNLVAVAGLQNAGTPEAVQGVAALCPILDFEDQWRYLNGLPGDEPMRGMLEGAAVQYLGGTPEQMPELARSAGAFGFITAQAPAFYLQHGTRDPAIPVEQTRSFAQALRATGTRRPVVLDILEGVAHAGGGPDFLEEEHIAPIFDFFSGTVLRRSLYENNYHPG